jgi:hypothetical protein
MSFLRTRKLPNRELVADCLRTSLGSRRASVSDSRHTGTGLMNSRTVGKLYFTIEVLPCTKTASHFLERSAKLPTGKA